MLLSSYLVRSVADLCALCPRRVRASAMKPSFSAIAFSRRVMLRIISFACRSVWKIYV